MAADAAVPAVPEPRPAHVVRPAHGVRLFGVVAAVTTGTAALIWGLASVLPGSGATQPASSSGALEASAYGKLPLRFEANHGQIDSQVDFVARGAGYTLFLTPRESVLSLAKRGSGAHGPKDADSAILRTRLAGANPQPRVAGVDRLPGETNYLRGGAAAKSQTGLPGFAKVRYRDVYPGVDLLYYGRQGRLEYDFMVSAGADPTRIGLEISGARRLALDGTGNLQIKTQAGTVAYHKPVVYQQIAGQRHRVAASFVLGGHGGVSFRFGAYDHSRPLVIDPVVVYSTYLGGLLDEFGTAIAADGPGNAYIAGTTASADFPTQDPIRGGPNQSTDVFVSKLNPSGSALLYSTYLGGAASEGSSWPGIAVDSAGAAYVTGGTSSSDFPTTAGAYQPASAGGSDVFVAKLAPNGSSLAYSTYLGGSGSEAAFGAPGVIKVDGSGNAYIGAQTTSTNFPTTAGAYKTTFGGTGDAVVTKLNPAGSALVYSTYLGGSGDDAPLGIDIDVSNNAYVIGSTDSTNFPTTAGAYQPAKGGGNDAFVTKLNASGSALAYSTYLGGAGADFGTAIAVGRGTADAGRAYVTGNAPSGGFPTTPGAYAATPQSNDAFVTKLNATGTALDYSTYLGGSGTDFATGMAVDRDGAAYVTGTTAPSFNFGTGSSDPADFPIVRPVAVDRGGGGFVTKLNSAGSGLAWSTTLGRGRVQDVALDPSENVYLTGTTGDLDFPTQNPLQPKNRSGAFGAANDGFVAKLAGDDFQAPYVTSVTPKGDDGAGGRAVRITGTGFASATSVDFGGVPASSFEVLSPTEIAATAPAHAEGEARVTVTRGGRTSPPNPISRFVYGEGRWSTTDPLPGRLPGGTATLLNGGKVLFAGGQAQGLDGVTRDTNTAYLYDPKSGTWSATGSLSRSRSGHTATLLQSGKVLVVSGATAELYDPGTGTWTPTNGAPTASRSQHTATLLQSGKVLLVGGVAAPASAELYDPGTDSFRATGGAPKKPRRAHTATVLDNGQVLVVGGFEAPESAELYDPAGETFTETGTLGTGRAQHTETLLPDGKVLVVGGSGGGFFFFAASTAELYDPATGLWSTTGPPASLRMDHAATLLPNGKVLIAGGDIFNAGLDTSELFDPTLGGGSGGFRSAGRMEDFSATSGGRQLTAIVLSSEPGGFAADEAVCGSRCGQVLLVGPAASNTAELYTPKPPDSPGGGEAPAGVPGPGTVVGVPGVGPSAGGGDRSGPPLVELSGRVTQRLPVIEVFAEVDEPATLQAGGTIAAPRTVAARLAGAARRKAKSFRLPAVRRDAPAHTKTRLRFRVSRRAVAVIKRRLRRGRRGTARIRVVATDLAGKQSTVFRTVRIKR